MGTAHYFYSDEVLEFLMLFAKFYIYKSKIQKKTPKLEQFICELKARYFIEKYIASVNDAKIHFENMWSKYLNLIDTETN